MSSYTTHVESIQVGVHVVCFATPNAHLIDRSSFALPDGLMVTTDDVVVSRTDPATGYN